jgi:ABC-type transport system involved in cytochrome c biogenesis permease subunit
MLFSTVLATVFIIINIAKPEIHDQTLMPALQSVWFVPHVSIYMFSYALLGCATLLAVGSLLKPRLELDAAIERLIYGGLAFLTIGMLTGALWAKDAWGAYWSWDARSRGRRRRGVSTSLPRTLLRVLWRIGRAGSFM